MESGFLDKVEDNALSKPGLRQHSGKKVIWYLQWRNTLPYFVA
ncbi:hypothetical protein Gotri_027078 [Gossypium trilobum]|uniref:Uncharacterized protein n=1 Tax=Gossypium trilobum TaxID=34281 RepID=A0A7J9FPQ1_9ROSI|nr:hypothetical protein [Gossypium trilobum]